jgi:predicted transcriptional regulator
MRDRKRKTSDLTRRERQIMDVIYENGRATAAEVRDGIPDAPSYSAVRALLRLLEEKGFVRHVQDGPRYVYVPTTPRTTAARSALDQVVRTFFDGSVEQTVATLLDARSRDISDGELERLAELIEQARKEGR